MLVGTKCDGDTKVSASEVLDLDGVKDSGVIAEVIECSAKDDINIMEVIQVGVAMIELRPLQIRN